uniref:Uncharacterized protein n=1 Tax=Fundulus heteroclitus TaxID=8078 RepID=A0A3Q2UJ37_FUNHE
TLANQCPELCSTLILMIFAAVLPECIFILYQSVYLGKCAPGFYRQGSNLFFGRCVPCECNGLADECEDGTGRCLNCKDNTAGDRCERCREGYYGSAAQGTCRLCPCPFTIFAVSCGDVSGDIQCVCKPGYTGVRCESCAPGYYGDPLIPGRSCQPCNCNGNGNSCDPKTGECDNCAQTLLNDLEKLDTELARIKAQLDNASVSGALKERLDKLEKAVSDTKAKGTNIMYVILCLLFVLQDFEQLAAQLDDAKTDLTTKVNELTKAVAKKDLVEDAEEHAKNLTKLAKELEEAVKNASGRSEVRDAKDAMEAYENITRAINAAEAAAKEAQDAADSALDIVVPMSFTGEGHVELRPPKDLDDLKAYTTMSLSLQRPKNRGDGRRRRRQVADSGDVFVLYLGHRDSSKNYIGMVLKKNRLYGLYKLNGQEYEIESGLISTSADNPAIFDKVDLRRMYQDAELNLTSDVTSGKSSEPFQKTKQGMESKNLLDLSPDDVVFYVGGYPSNFTPPPSMRFSKYTGCIEFNSFNTKAVSLYNFQKAEKINAKTPCSGIHLLPLSLHIISRVWTELISSAWSLLGCQLQKTQTTMKAVDIAGESVIFVPLSGDRLETTNEGYNFDTYKDLYIGGLPRELRERWNITTQPFKGCSKTLKINNNFKVPDEQVGISKRCKEDSLVCRVHISIISTISNSVIKKYIIVFLFFPLSRPHFSLDVRTRSPEGLLFFAATRGGHSHLALYMSKGRIRLSVGKQKEIFNREKYNDGKWHSVIFSLEKKKFRLVVDGIRAQDGQLTNAELKSMQHFLLPVYLGSAPESLQKELKALPKQSVSGCVRNFKMNGAPMSNPSANHGAGPCFEGPTHRGAYFAGNGSYVIISEHDSFVFGSDLELLFNIHPRSQTGLLLYVGDSTRKHACVVAHVNNGRGEYMTSVKPKTSLCDGNFHKISGETQHNIVLLPDRHSKTHLLFIFFINKRCILGSEIHRTLKKDTLMQQMLPVKSSFVGCIQDMKINDVSVSFHRSSGVFGPINLKECPG